MSNKIGRPLKFETPEELEAAIDEYLCSEKFEDLTVTGLALAVGTNRQVLTDYEKREDYGDIVKRAKCIIEHSYEVSLRKHGRAGDIFGLKNFGWRDQQHIESVSDNTNREVYDDETVERVADRLKALLGGG